MNKTGYIVIGVVAFLFLLLFVLGGGDKSKSTNNTNQNDALAVLDSSVLPDEVCTWTDGHNNFEEFTTKDKLYVVSSRIDRPEEKQHLIMTDGYLGDTKIQVHYRWGLNDGVGTSEEYLTPKAEVNESITMAVVHELSKKSSNKTCRPWSVDARVFVAPTDIKFTTL